MLFEIVSSLAVGGLVGAVHVHQRGLVGNDTQAIVRIAANAGLTAKDGTNIRIHRRTTRRDYSEYAFQLPQGLSAQQFRDKLDRFQDGLNAKKRLLDVSLADIKRIDWRGDIGDQLRKLLRKSKNIRKEVEISFDGMLIFRVYNEALTEYLAFDEAMLAQCRGWEIPLGQARGGFVRHDTELGHMVVAGATRYGKSVFLKNVITSLIARKPEDVRLTLIDLKGGLTFARYQSAQQVATVAIDVAETLTTLIRLDAEMTAKQAKYLAQGYEDVREAGDTGRHFILVDEAAQLASKGVTDSEEKKMRIECERILARIAQVGAGLGYRLIFCTQYPTADTLPRQIKQNADTRVCFRLQTAIASQVVLDEDGAEALPKVRGRAIYLTPDGKQIVQTPFIENEYIERTIAPHKRKERAKHESDTCEKATPRKHTLIVEKTRLS
ncbi:FtsK/SpoIIIE domain-containing protein [Mesobacillus zeae]|uniref:Cell division protein FtsK n=1 Tax=Mesobacillus zeae TaxID=1917180 RepID=A0A398BNI0_9BACI|nr:FtsK/SpoIIIE domain-containing protein [Mesobacillus zeae]RID88923.1 cell division protein FtsK [Mesobacillus zeae]